MSIEKIIVTLGCDYCANSIDIEATNVQSVATDEPERVAAEWGWWQRPDGTDVCPKHPRPVAA